MANTYESQRGFHRYSAIEVEKERTFSHQVFVIRLHPTADRPK
jgi:hypothetical protein